MRYIKLIFLLIISFEFNAQDVANNLIKKNNYESDFLSPNFHAERRKLLRDSLPDKSVAVFFANPIRTRSNDVQYEYHQDPNFYYLTGFKEPHSMLIVFKEPMVLGEQETDEIIFVRDRNPDKEIWDGRRLGVDGAQEKLGISTVMLNRIFADLEFNFSQFDHVYYILPDGHVNDDDSERGDLYSMMKHFKRKLDTLDDPKEARRLQYYMNGLRQNKEPEELALMQKAIDITCEAHRELMKSLDTSYTEYKAEALVEYVFKLRGAEYPGFPSIVGAGENSCILHYVTNRRMLNKGDLMVVDIGAEYHGYTADITRTLPIDGAYSEEQALIYDVVLQAQNAGIEACQAGNKFWDPHNAATRVIQRELQKLGITTKRYDARKYFMHGTSHYLGLDVHDAGLYGSLKPGQVITVEPGIYIPEGSDCDPKWWNIGVRIEDDILITDHGPVNMSQSIPRSMDEIEALMKVKSDIDDFLK